VIKRYNRNFTLEAKTLPQLGAAKPQYPVNLRKLVCPSQAQKRTILPDNTVIFCSIHPLQKCDDSSPEPAAPLCKKKGEKRARDQSALVLASPQMGARGSS
jgi:hypothetical protein